MWDRGTVRAAEGKRDGSNVSNTLHEPANDVSLSKVKDLGGVESTIIIDHLRDESIVEGREVQHVEENSLGWTDLVAFAEDLDVVDDFNVTTNNLGLNVNSLEEGSLLGIKTRGTLVDHDNAWSDGAYTSRGSDAVLNASVTNVRKITVGEDETNVTLDVWEDLHPLFVLSLGDSSAHEGVLTEEDLAAVAENDTNVLELLGANIVSVDDEDLGVLREVFLDLLEVKLLPCASVDLDHFER
jgi:hypothetical protein